MFNLKVGGQICRQCAAGRPLEGKLPPAGRRRAAKRPLGGRWAANYNANKVAAGNQIVGRRSSGGAGGQQLSGTAGGCP